MEPLDIIRFEGTSRKDMQKLEWWFRQLKDQRWSLRVVCDRVTVGKESYDAESGKEPNTVKP